MDEKKEIIAQQIESEIGEVLDCDDEAVIEQWAYELDIQEEPCTFLINRLKVRKAPTALIKRIFHTFTEQTGMSTSRPKGETSMQKPHLMTVNTF